MRASPVLTGNVCVNLLLHRGYLLYRTPQGFREFSNELEKKLGKFMNLKITYVFQYVACSWLRFLLLRAPFVGR